MPRQRFADQRKTAHIEVFPHTSLRGRHSMAQPAARAEQTKQMATLTIDIVFAVCERSEFAHAPALEFVSELTMAVIEKRPFEKATIHHFSHP